MSSQVISKKKCTECHTMKCLGAENDEGKWMCHVCWDAMENGDSSDSESEQTVAHSSVVEVVHEYSRVIIDAERLMFKKRTDDILEIYERIESLDGSYPRVGAFRGLYSLQRKAFVESA